MIKLASADFYFDGGIKVSIPEMKITIQDQRYIKGFVGYKIKEIDLKKLVGTTVIHEYPDTARRRAEAAERTKKNKTNRMIMGAIGGGLIDSALGDDDSVIDGMIAGAAIGYLTTPESQIDLKEQSNHYVILFFSDGNSISVLANAKGIADILRIEHKARAIPLTEKAGEYIESRELNKNELAMAEKGAYQKKKDENCSWGFGLLFVALLVIVGTGIAHLFFGGAMIFTAEDIEGYKLGFIILGLVVVGIMQITYGSMVTRGQLRSNEIHPEAVRG